MSSILYVHHTSQLTQHLQTKYTFNRSLTTPPSIKHNRLSCFHLILRLNLRAQYSSGFILLLSTAPILGSATFIQNALFTAFLHHYFPLLLTIPLFYHLLPFDSLLSAQVACPPYWFAVRLEQVAYPPY